MLEFPYQPERIANPPPSLPPGSTAQWRPFVPVWIVGPAGRSRFFTRALLDTGSQETVFPLDLADYINVRLLDETAHGLRWRGRQYTLRFGQVNLELSNDHETCRWPAIVAFSDAPIRYPLLGQNGCLQYFDAAFHGADRLVRLETNLSYPATT